MTTLTETIIDLADCHTTLYYLGAKPPQVAALPLGTAESYCGLYKTVAAPARVTYSDVSGGNPGRLLMKLSPVYRDNNYWEWYLGSRELDIYHEYAWDNIIPIEASIATRIEFIADARFNFNVSPIPRVLLYPFGWSACLSLRLTGAHTPEELSAFVQHVFTAKAFHLEPDPAPPGQPPSAHSLRDLFDHVAQGVRNDAFGGNKKDNDSQQIIAVTTVLGKHGGGLALGGLSVPMQEQILRLVKPEGPAPKEPFLKYIFRRSEDEDEEYVVHNDQKRFIWLKHLLKAEDRNYDHLRCYHNNTFRSLVQARHFFELLGMAGKQKSMSDPLQELVQTAINNLEITKENDELVWPGIYQNASLREFLQDPAIAKAIKKVKKPAQSDKDDV
jgi:hypothetical protein